MFTTKRTMPTDPSSPTCHLTAIQRVQLMKSTRKVAKLLGATPQIKIRNAPPLIIRNQDGVLVVHERQSSLDDVTTLLPPRITAPRATSAPSSPLFVPNAAMLEAQGRASLRRRAPRLQIDSSGPCADTGLKSLSSPRTLAQPLSPPLITPATPATARRGSFFPPTPMTAVCESDSARAARERRLYRKRLSKLGRTFGQAVPPALVPAPASVTTRPAPRRRRGRRSLYVSVGAAAATSPAISYSTLNSSSIAESDQENVPPVPKLPSTVDSARPSLRIKVASPPTAYQPLPPSWQAMPKMKEVEEVFEGPREILVEVERKVEVFEYTESPQSLRRAASFEVLSPAVLQFSNLPPRSQSVEPLRRLPTPDAEDMAELFASHSSWRPDTYGSDVQPDIPPRSNSRLAQIFLGKAQDQEPKSVAYRSERRQGWSGEWNASSVQDVIVRLRELK